MRVAPIGMVGLVVAASIAAAGARAADYEPGTPSTYLFDTGSTSTAALPGMGLEPTSAWALVPEDNITRKFQGDAVVRNDRLIVVLRAKGAGAEVYGQSPAGAKLRAVLAPVTSSGSKAAALVELRILENGPAAVMLAATFAADDDKRCSLTYRLTAGQVMVEVRPGEGTGRVLVHGTTRHVVVPDFFGDDMVFRADDVSRPRLRMPAENFFLQMADGGNALVMCVWQSGAQSPSALRSGSSGQAAFSGCEIEAMKDKSIWVACLEGAGLWHERTIADVAAKAEIALDWKPPFPAKWRTGLLGANGIARSWYFRSQDDAGEPNQTTSPCCLEAGRAVVRLPLDPLDGRAPATLLTYLMDRNRETPLVAFCPIDVLRNTLGVGPCQYILQTEGFSVETSPTPDSAMTWVEKQFSRKKQKKAADEIRELLDQMVAHIGHTQARIEQYGRFARDVRAICKSAASPSAKSLEEITARLEQAVATTASKAPPPEHAARIAREVVILTGGESTLADCENLGAEARAIGAVQDRALANCRMAVRWLKESATMLGEDDPSAAAMASEVRTRAERMLQPQAPNAVLKP
jgi:hypothetical protein